MGKTNLCQNIHLTYNLLVLGMIAVSPSDTTDAADWSVLRLPD